MRAFCLLVVLGGVVPSVFAQYALTDVVNSSETERFAGNYAAGNSNSFAYAAINNDLLAQSTYRVDGGSKSTLETTGFARQLWMNGSGDLAYNHQRQVNINTRESKMVFNSGGTSDTLAITQLSSGSFNTYFGRPYLADSGALVFGAFNGTVSYRLNSGDTFATASPAAFPGTTAIGSDGSFFVSRSVAGSVRLSRVDQGGMADLLVPGGGGTVSSMGGTLGADVNGNVYFRGLNSSNVETIFRYSVANGVTDLAPFVPSNPGTILSVSNGGKIAFLASPNGTQGIYVYDGSSTTLAVSVGDTLRGLSINELYLSSDAWTNDGRLMFGYTLSGAGAFDFGGYAYAAPVPEPGTIALLGLGLAAISKRRRK